MADHWTDRLARLDRRWIFLAMGLCVLGPLLRPVRMPLAISNPAQRYHDAIESVPAGSIVIMPMDYDPAFTAEVHPMAVATLRRLLEKNVSVITCTLQPAGPPMADQAFAEVGPPLHKKYGVDFVNLGYKSGNEVVVLAMGTSIRGTFPSDTQGTPLEKLPLMNRIDRLGDARLLVEIAATSAGNIWVQQAQGRFHVEMIAGVAGVMAPEFFPYLQAGQVRGLLGGMAGAAEYEKLAGHAGTATRGMDAQSLAHLLVVLLILIGNGLYFALQRRGKAAGAVALLLVACTLAGCGGTKRREQRATAGTVEGIVESGSPDGNPAPAPPDTSREGAVFVARYGDGPVDEIRMTRATSGGIVLQGAGGFPDGTKVMVALQRLRPGTTGTPRYEAVATSIATVELGRFTSEPLMPLSGPPPQGPVRVRVTATFAPGQQTAEVLSASAHGRRYKGHGMHAVGDDYAIYETTLEAPL